MPLNPPLCELRRAAYGYPPARIRRKAVPSKLLMPAYPYGVKDPGALGWPTKRARFSSWGLDAYHRRLLHSSSPQDRFDGVLSIVYWGNFAGSNGKPTGYAAARARWLLAGKPTNPPDTVLRVASQVALAGSFLSGTSPHLINALQAVRRVKFIGLSFASKVLAFMEPGRCAILDSVLLGAFRISADPRLRATRNTPAGFDAWCTRCYQTAAALNAAHSTWIDWNGVRYKWRAVDVERAAFSHAVLMRDPTDLLV